MPVFNPFKFDENNKRIVTNADRPNTVLYASAAIFLFSMHVYNRKMFRKNGNVLNLVAFTALSVPVSYTYACTLMWPAHFEAALINNENEHKH